MIGIPIDIPKISVKTIKIKEFALKTDTRDAMFHIVCRHLGISAG